MKTNARTDTMRHLLSITIFTAMTLLVVQQSFGQTEVLPAEPQSAPIMLVGATVHVGNGDVIDNGAVGFDGGEITVVGDAGSVDRVGFTVIDVTGMHVYPGFILPTTTLGLNEVGQVPATVDQSEVGDFNPNVRSLIAYNTDSELIPTLRFNGILLAQSTPTSGVISGTSSVMMLDGWNWEDAVYRADDAVHINWPAQHLPARWWLGETYERENESYNETIETLEKMFSEAAVYAEADNSDRNLKLEALLGTLDGSQSLFAHTNDAKSMIEAVAFAERHSIDNLVIVGGHEAVLVADLLVEKKIPVVLANVHRTPPRDHEDTVYPYKLASELSNAGITVALGYDGTMNSRNLPFFAGTTVAFGMEYEEALKLITLNPARIMGIDSTTGSIESGKDANLIVSAGDVFDMRTNNLRYAFIKGAAIQLDARQQSLYEKYSRKYGHDR